MEAAARHVEQYWCVAGHREGMSMVFRLAIVSLFILIP